MTTKKPTKSVMVKFRAEEKLANRITLLANLYAGGNVSLWLKYAALHAPRRFITQATLTPRPRRKK